MREFGPSQSCWIWYESLPSRGEDGWDGMVCQCQTSHWWYFVVHLLGCLLCRVGLEEDKKGMRELRRDFKGRDRGGESSF